MTISAADKERIAYAQSLLDRGVFRTNGSANGLSEYVELCEAIGLTGKNMAPLDVFLISGRIFNEVRDLDRLAAIKAMTPEQRTHLRHRVTGVSEMPRKFAGLDLRT